MKKPKNLLLLMLMTVTSCSGLNADVNHPNPSAPPVTSTSATTDIASATPSSISTDSISQLPITLLEMGWEVLDTVESAFNNNGYRYVFVIYQKTHTKNIPKRKLFVIKEFEDGNYEVITKNKHAILKSDEGGVWGDPYSSMEITENLFLLKFYGGSNWRWQKNYTFELKPDSIQLVEYYQTYFNIGAIEDESPKGIIKGEGSRIEERNYKDGFLEKKENDGGEINTSITKIKEQGLNISEFDIRKL